MKYQYYICDVFTETRFGGNQLAVLPKAEGLTPEQMQQITREFNFSETAFVFPAKARHTRHVRIFTPASEIPFAGHPNVGTAFVLATVGELGELRLILEPGKEELEPLPGFPLASTLSRARVGTTGQFALCPRKRSYRPSCLKRSARATASSILSTSNLFMRFTRCPSS